MKKERRCASLFLLYLLFEKTVAVTVVIEVSHTTQLQSCFSVPLGIEFYHLQPVGGDEYHEGDKMFLGHGMVDRDKMLILHSFNGNGMVVIHVFCFQRGQGNTTAADQGISGAVYCITADGTDIELAPQHIGGGVLVGDLFAVHQLNDGNSQSLCQ